MKNYSEVFKRLLWTEEVQSESDIRSFDMIGTTMRRRGQAMVLTVPGLAENRPSVLRGDRLLVVKHGRTYEGYAHFIRQEEIELKLNKSFHSSYLNNERVDVRFEFRRMPLRIAHQALPFAVGASSTGGGLDPQTLFPTKDSVEPRPSLVSQTYLNDMVWYNRHLNEEQCLAVRGILAAVARPTPYLLYGPPGTGKTVTLVEAILQTLRLSPPSARLLLCAPSNSAADLLVERLAMNRAVAPSQMFRINAYTRDKQSVSEVVGQYSNFDDETDAYEMPDNNALVG